MQKYIPLLILFICALVFLIGYFSFYQKAFAFIPNPTTGVSYWYCGGTNKSACILGTNPSKDPTPRYTNSNCQDVSGQNKCSPASGSGGSSGGGTDECSNASCGPGTYCGGACGVTGSDKNLYTCSGTCDGSGNCHRDKFITCMDNSNPPTKLTCKRNVVGGDQCPVGATAPTPPTVQANACENNGGNCLPSQTGSTGNQICPNNKTTLPYSCSYGQSGGYPSGAPVPGNLICCGSGGNGGGNIVNGVLCGTVGTKCVGSCDPKGPKTCEEDDSQCYSNSTQPTPVPFKVINAYTCVNNVWKFDHSIVGGSQCYSNTSCSSYAPLGIGPCGPKDTNGNQAGQCRPDASDGSSQCLAGENASGPCRGSKPQSTCCIPPKQNISNCSDASGTQGICRYQVTNTCLPSEGHYQPADSACGKNYLCCVPKYSTISNINNGDVNVTLPDKNGRNPVDIVIDLFGSSATGVTPTSQPMQDFSVDPSGLSPNNCSPNSRNSYDCNVTLTNNTNKTLNIKISSSIKAVAGTGNNGIPVDPGVLPPLLFPNLTCRNTGNITFSDGTESVDVPWSCVSGIPTPTDILTLTPTSVPTSTQAPTPKSNLMAVPSSLSNLNTFGTPGAPGNCTLISTAPNEKWDCTIDLKNTGTSTITWKVLSTAGFGKQQPTVGDNVGTHDIMPEAEYGPIEINNLPCISSGSITFISNDNSNDIATVSWSCVTGINFLASRVLGASAVQVKGQLTYDGASGNYINHNLNLANVTPGTYQIFGHINKYLDVQFVQPNGSKFFTVAPGQKINLTNVTFIPGDVAPVVVRGISGDNIIDIADYNLVISCMGAATPLSATCKNADLNDDGRVDIEDFNILLSHYGSSGASPTTLQIQCVTDPNCQSGGTIQFCALKCSVQKQ